MLLSTFGQAICNCFNHRNTKVASQFELYMILIVKHHFMFELISISS